MDSTNLQRKRIQSIDLLRGLVMIIMALDHVRDYVHHDSFVINPTDLGKTSVALFATRWITHFCAPVFVFLAGTSAFLSGQRKTKQELSFFLVTRGVWLILLEISIISIGWSFSIDFHHYVLAVIWALGASMIALAILIWLPFPVILLLGSLLVAGHNFFDTWHIAGNGPSAFGWRLLHEMGDTQFGDYSVFVMYPILPWTGLMALGYCMGVLYADGFDAAKRKRILTMLGVTAIVVFIGLRLFNVYGDPGPWSVQTKPAFTLLSFLNTTKYPPSLLYLCMTLGPALLFLAFSENLRNGFTRFLTVYGKVPMFYYICHLYLIHLAGVLMGLLQGYKPGSFDREPPADYGLSLGMTYVVWIVIVLLLYPACTWYEGYKSAHREKKWLSYL